MVAGARAFEVGMLDTPSMGFVGGGGLVAASGDVREGHGSDDGRGSGPGEGRGRQRKGQALWARKPRKALPAEASGAGRVMAQGRAGSIGSM